MKAITKLQALLLCLLLATGVAGAPNQLLEQLRADHAALVAAESDFRQRRGSGSLVGAEATDYAAYVARLRRQVAEDCLALERSGAPVPAGLSCPEYPVVYARPADIDQSGEQTVFEQTALLDAELDAGLGDFDELLLREQERVKAAMPSADAAGGAAGGAGGSGEEGDGDGEGGAGDEFGEGGATGEGDDDAAEGDQQVTGTGRGQTSSGARGGSGTRNQRTAKGQPEDIPDGSDDDVVARQLREAAEKETDPELKKKLWEEYRKYKKGTR